MAPRFSLCSAALASLLLAAGGCGAREADGDGPLRVGVVLPMTGAQANFGKESWQGLRLAEEDLRAAGDAPAFDLILADEKSEPIQAELQSKALIEVKGAHVLLGSVASSNSYKVATVAKAAGVPAITPASTNDGITADNPYMSRICYKDTFQGTVLADFAAERGWKNAAVIVDSESDYSRGLSDTFRKRFGDLGGTATAIHFKAKAADYSNVIQSVADAKPDVIFFSGYYEDGGKMIRQAATRWGETPVLGGDGLDGASFIELVGDSTIPIYFSTHFAPDADDERVRTFARRYQERFGEPPGAMAALGYDVLLVLVDAVKRCTDPRDPEQLKDAIAKTRGVVGITGTIHLDNEERTPTKAAVIVKLDRGVKRFQATIEP